MEMADNSPLNELDFKCSHCEKQGFNYKNIIKEHHAGSVQVSIHNLPVGLTLEGVKNLFLKIGKPLDIHFNAYKKCAYVTLESLNQAELTIRDLHLKPPFKLQVSLVCPKTNKSISLLESLSTSKKDDASNLDSNTNFIGEEIIFDRSQKCDDKISKIPDKIQELYKTTDYDPSYRVHRKKCDYKVLNGISISKGRGYYYMGDINFNALKLEECKYSSENDKDFFQNDCEDEKLCVNCVAPTFKQCSLCSKPYCSKFCMLENESHINSQCLDGMGKELKDHTLKKLKERDCIELKTSSTVVITTFLTLKTAFVRQVDSYWEEKFVRLCNDVTISVMKGQGLEEPLMIDHVYAVKFYEDGFYYRGKILSVKSNNLIVFFLDFGNTQETNPKDVKPLLEDLKVIPGLAVKVNLANISEGTSAQAVEYLNELTAQSITLVLKFNDSIEKGVVLVEKDTDEVVNDKINKLIQPSWRKDTSALSKLGDVFYIESVPVQVLDVGISYNLKLSYINEDEFKEDGCFWLVNPDEDYFMYLQEELRVKMMEYCTLLEDDFYLPRESELCLAIDNEEWYRCVCLNSVGTKCWLFFIDDGKTSFVQTKDIRKMARDFIECPQQAIRCVFSGEDIMKDNRQRRLDVLDYLKRMHGEKLNSVVINKFAGGDYHVGLREVDELLKKEQ